jgi:hypothetical protein
LQFQEKKHTIKPRVLRGVKGRCPLRARGVPLSGAGNFFACAKKSPKNTPGASPWTPASSWKSDDKHRREKTMSPAPPPTGVPPVALSKQSVTSLDAAPTVPFRFFVLSGELGSRGLGKSTDTQRTRRRCSGTPSSADRARAAAIQGLSQFKYPSAGR